MISIGGTASTSSKHPRNPTCTDGKIGKGSFTHNQRRMTTNYRHKKDIALAGGKHEPKRFPTSSESNLAYAFHAAQFKALSPAHIDHQRGIDGLSAVNSQVLFLKNTRQSMDYNSSMTGMPSDFGEFAHARHDALNTSKRKQKKRRLYSASIKVLDSHAGNTRPQKDYNNLERAVNGMPYRRSFKQSLTFHSKNMYPEIVGHKLSPKQNPHRSFKASSKHGPRSMLSQYTTTAQSNVKSSLVNQTEEKLFSPTRVIDDEPQSVQQQTGLIFNVESEEFDLGGQNERRPSAFTGAAVGSPNNDILKVINYNNSMLNIPVKAKRGAGPSTQDDSTYHSRIRVEQYAGKRSRSSTKRMNSSAGGQNRKRSTPLTPIDGAYQDANYDVLGRNQAGAVNLTFSEADKNLRPLMSGRQGSTILAEGSIDLPSSNTGIEFDIFRTQNAHIPLKHVASAGQFNIAKTIDNVSVKVTEVNTVPPTTYADETGDITNNYRNESKKRKQAKNRPKTGHRKQMKQSESESPYKFRRLVKCVAQGNGPVFEKRAIVDTQSGVLSAVVNSPIKTGVYSPSRQAANQTQSNFSTTGLAMTGHAFPITTNNLYPNSKCNFKIKPAGNLADYGMVDPETEKLLKQDLYEVVDNQLVEERRQHVKQKRAKLILETQINKEKQIIANKFASQTTQQYDRNISNQKRVFDPRFRAADFPPNFWFGKYAPKEPQAHMTKKIVKYLKNCLSEQKRQRRTYFRPEMIGTIRDRPTSKDAEIALQYYKQYHDVLPPRQVARRGTCDIQMPLAFSHMADESLIGAQGMHVDPDLDKLRITSSRKRGPDRRAAKHVASKVSSQRGGTPSRKGFLVYDDGAFTLERGTEAGMKRRATSSQEVTPNDSFDNKKRAIRIEHSHPQTLEDEQENPTEAPSYGGASVREMRSNYADKVEGKIEEVQEQNEEMNDSQESDQIVEFKGPSVLENRLAELRASTFAPVESQQHGRNRNNLTAVNVLQTTNPEQYAIYSSIMKYYSDLVPSKDMQEVCSVQLQKQVTDIYPMGCLVYMGSLGSQVGFADSVSFMEPACKYYYFSLRQQESMRSLQQRETNYRVFSPVKGLQQSISPKNKGTMSSFPTKTSQARPKTAKHKLTKKKSVVISDHLYRKATLDVKPQDCLSKKALIEAQSTTATADRRLLSSKTKSMPLLDILKQTKSEKVPSRQPDIKDMISDTELKKTVYFYASVLFKDRLTSQNVLPKTNIKYITSPLKMLVMK